LADVTRGWERQRGSNRASHSDCTVPGLSDDAHRLTGYSHGPLNKD